MALFSFAVNQLGDVALRMDSIAIPRSGRALSVWVASTATAMLAAAPFKRMKQGIDGTLDMKERMPTFASN